MRRAPNLVHVCPERIPTTVLTSLHILNRRPGGTAVEVLHQSKIQQFVDVTAPARSRSENVCRFETAMNQTCRVCRKQCERIDQSILCRHLDDTALWHGMRLQNERSHGQNAPDPDGGSGSAEV